jgi:septin 7
VNSMFLTNIYSREDNIIGIDQDQTLQVETHEITLEENGVRLALTIVDTPGFGDAVDNTQCWKPIIAYVEKQFEDYLEGETRVERVELPDKRVHACLYFIAPTGHGLKPLDIQFMKKIHNKVNIIPVIGKADSCTVNEINLFKTKVDTEWFI